MLFRSAGGLPTYRMAREDQFDHNGMLAAWSPNDPEHPEGVVLINADHRVLEDEVRLDAPDLGTALVYVAILFAVVFAAGAKKREMKSNSPLLRLVTITPLVVSSLRRTKSGCNWRTCSSSAASTR